MKKLAATWLISMALALPASAQQATSPSFTAAQRSEIVAIMRQALKTDPSLLRDAVEALQQDDTLRQEAAARQTIDSLAPVLRSQPGDPIAGNPQGDVTLVEFYDVRCPFCRRMLPVLASLVKSDPGLRVVYKDLPILGPGSVLGARALLAAQAQGGYQRLHDALMEGSPDIDMARIQAAATGVGLDWGRLRHDMDDPAVQARIDANLEIGRQLRIDGTPAYLVGTRMIPGAVDLAALRQAVAEARAAPH